MRQGCPFCGGELAHAVKDLACCVRCGLYRKERLPDKATILRQTRHMMLRACTNPKSLASRMSDADRQVRILAEHTQPGTLYDVGAAAGFFMKAAQDAGWEVYGNEISVSAIEWAKQHYGLSIDYGMLEDVAPSEDAFDAVVLWNTLEHVWWPDETLDLCKRMLRVGGLLFIEVPTKNEQEIIDDYEAPHLTEFGKDNLREYVERIGFETLEWMVFDEGALHHVNFRARRT